MDDNFITFGCWNKGDPDDPSLPLYHLFYALEESIKINKPEFIFVTGDNYYPPEKYKRIPESANKRIPDFTVMGGGGDKDNKKKKKDKKKKIAIIDHLEASFAKLTKIGIDHESPILMCTGNHENHEKKPHDLKPLYPDKEESKDEGGGRFGSNPSSPVLSPETKETLEEKEKNELTTKGGNVYFRMGIPEIDHSINNTNIRVIDTEADPISAVGVPLKGNFIFGHKPLFALHLKEERIWDKNENVCEYFQLLSQHHKGNYVYICADTHNYQDISITYENGFTLRQIVVGSGGTFEMDLLPDEGIIKNEEFLSSARDSGITGIHINDAQTGKHGFCRCSLSEPGKNHFIPYFSAVHGARFIPLNKLGGGNLKNKSKNKNQSKLKRKSKRKRKKSKLKSKRKGKRK